MHSIFYNMDKKRKSDGQQCFFTGNKKIPRCTAFLMIWIKQLTSCSAYFAYSPEVHHLIHAAVGVSSFIELGVQEKLWHDLCVVEHGWAGHTKCHWKKNQMEYIKIQLSDANSTLKRNTKLGIARSTTDVASNGVCLSYFVPSLVIILSHCSLISHCLIKY